MINIWFEPHSTTLDNEAKIASGWNDVDLSAKGFQESEELTKRAAERNIEVIFCSDLQRAVKSAVPSARELRIPIYPDKRLRECNYGDFTQKPSDIVTAEKPKRISEPFPNGESYQQTMDRMKSFLDYLKKDFDSKTVMIIGHRATHYGLDHHILGKPVEDCINENWVWQAGWNYEIR